MMSILAKRLAIATLIGAGSVAVSGCTTFGAYPGYGYDDYGYDDGYYGGGGYYGGRYGYDPYYDDYRAGYPNIGYAGGWYRGYYYPGYGRYVYDRWGRPHAMDSYYRNYWGGWRDDYRYRYMGQTQVRRDRMTAEARERFLRQNARPTQERAPQMVRPRPGSPGETDDLIRAERQRRGGILGRGVPAPQSRPAPVDNGSVSDSPRRSVIFGGRPRPAAPVATPPARPQAESGQRRSPIFGRPQSSAPAASSPAARAPERDREGLGSLLRGRRDPR